MKELVNSLYYIILIIQQLHFEYEWNFYRKVFSDILYMVYDQKLKYNIFEQVLVR